MGTGLGWIVFDFGCMCMGVAGILSWVWNSNAKADAALAVARATDQKLANHLKYVVGLLEVIDTKRAESGAFINKQLELNDRFLADLQKSRMNFDAHEIVLQHMQKDAAEFHDTGVNLKNKIEWLEVKANSAPRAPQFPEKILVGVKLYPQSSTKKPSRAAVVQAPNVPLGSAEKHIIKAIKDQLHNLSL